MLAEDFDESKLIFPLIAQPKIDGVRGLNMLGTLTGRSLKTHKNVYTTKFYSQSCLIGFDGELAANSETHPDLCRITSSALSTIAGEPFTLWWLFDYRSPKKDEWEYWVLGHPPIALYMRTVSPEKTLVEVNPILPG